MLVNRYCRPAKTRAAAVLGLALTAASGPALAQAGRGLVPVAPVDTSAGANCPAITPPSNGEALLLIKDGECWLPTRGATPTLHKGDKVKFCYTPERDGFVSLWVKSPGEPPSREFPKRPFVPGDAQGENLDHEPVEARGVTEGEGFCVGPMPVGDPPGASEAWFHWTAALAQQNSPASWSAVDTRSPDNTGTKSAKAGSSSVSIRFEVVTP